MKRSILCFLLLIALFVPRGALSQGSSEAVLSETSELGLSISAESATDVDGRKTTETSSGSFSRNESETIGTDGSGSSSQRNEVGLEHVTETEVSKGDHHEAKVGETDSLRFSSDVSNDEKNGDASSVGVGYSKGYDADAEAHIGSDGEYAGGNAEADAHAHAGADADVKWAAGPEGLEGSAEVKVGVNTEAHANAEGRLGTEDYNVHGEADVKISAELAAEIKARIMANEEGLGAEIGGKAGASIGAEGVIKGGVTIWGIPFDVSLKGGAKAGAEVSGKAGIVYDAKTGKLKLTLEGSAVAGVGANAGVDVEIGVGHLFGKVLDKFFGKGDAEEDSSDADDNGAGDQNGKDASSDGFWDSVVGFASGAWDYIGWISGGASEMQDFLNRVRSLFNQSPPETPAGGCPCEAEAYRNARDLLGKNWIRWQQAYSAVNGWAAVAQGLQTFNDAMKVVNNGLNLAVDKMNPVVGYAHDKIVSAAYAYAENGGNAGAAAVDVTVGKALALADNMRKLSEMSWGDCESNEERMAYLQLFLDVYDGVSQGVGSKVVNGADGVFQYMGAIDPGTLATLREFVDAAGPFVKVAQMALDTWRAYEDARRTAEEAGKYFSSVSEAMSVLKEMKMMVPAYEQVMARYREQVGSCHCGSSCTCSHCAKNDAPVSPPFTPTPDPTPAPLLPTDPTPDPGPVPVPSPTPTPEPVPTPTPEPVPTPTPEPVPTPGPTNPTDPTPETPPDDGGCFPGGESNPEVPGESGSCDDGDIWTNPGEIAKIAVEVIGFPILEEWIDEQLGNLTDKYPVIGEIFAALGIDTGSIMATIRNIWGVLTGPGSLQEKLQQLARDALQGLCNMLGSLLQYGIGKLADWLGNLVMEVLGSSGTDKALVPDGIGNPDILVSASGLLRMQRDAARRNGPNIVVDGNAGFEKNGGRKSGDAPGQKVNWSGSVE